MERMKNAINPLFTDMTWGAGGSTAELSLQLATHAHQNGHVANMHLTCTNMEKDGDPKKAVHEALKTSQENGINKCRRLLDDVRSERSIHLDDFGNFGEHLMESDARRFNWQAKVGRVGRQLQRESRRGAGTVCSVRDL